MIQLEQVSHSWGGAPLLHSVSWQLNHGDRVGLVGRNGSPADATGMAPFGADGLLALR